MLEERWRKSLHLWVVQDLGVEAQPLHDNHSSTRWACLERLHCVHAATRLSSVLPPPLLSGMRWSQCSATSWAPQYWQVLPSRAKTAARNRRHWSPERRLV